MKIAVIGSGDVGQSLAKGFLEAGHSVMLGTRDTKKKELDWARKHKSKRASVGSYAEAADFGEIAVLAVAWHAADNVLAIIRPELSGKIVIDVTNPLIFHEDNAPELAVGHDISAGEMVQQTLADSHVVKTLEHHQSPQYDFSEVLTGHSYDVPLWQQRLCKNPCDRASHGAWLARYCRYRRHREEPTHGARFACCG